MTLEDEQQLVRAQGSVLVGEADTTVELRVVTELLLEYLVF